MSGFHSLVASGTTVKQLNQETDALPIGYGAMLVEAALALENGEYSGIIQLDDMFYIIMTVGDEPNGTTPLADVYDEIKAMAANEAAEALWTARQEAWYNDTALVTYNETVYRDIGKSKS